MKERIGLVAVTWILLVAIVVYPDKQAQAAMVDVEITPGSSTGKTTDAYDPYPVEANVGDTVIWTNNDNTLHTATAGNPTDGPTGMFGGTAASPNYLGPGVTQEFTFTEEGEFDYYCTLHPAMIGTVIVGDGIGDGIFTKDFEFNQQGTAKIKKVMHDVSLTIEGEYLYEPEVGKPQIENDELVGTLAIDGVDFALKDIKMKVSNDMKRVSISAKVDEPNLNVLGVSGSLSTILKFDSAINFAEAKDADSGEKNNTLTVLMKGLKSSWSAASKDSEGYITFG